MTASPGNPLKAKKHSSLFLFVQSEKKFLEVSITIKATCFFTFLPINPWEKFIRSQNLRQNSLLYTLVKLFFNSIVMHNFQACWMR